ncbi:MAG TPA: alpha-hydroxy-acid oxidizing protein, partial [Streptosporangiaceae bacterium]
MKLREISQLIRMRPVELDATRRRLARCHDIHELRACAQRRIPRPVFDYVEGGADEELSMAANREAFTRWRFLPHTLVDVSAPDTSARVLDRTVPLPLALAPTGYTRMIDPAGEIGVARAAHRWGLPYTLSTMATTSIEELAAAAGPDRWFQLYVLKDPGLTAELVDRAA